MNQLGLAIVFNLACLSSIFVPNQAKQKATLKEFAQVFSRGLKRDNAFPLTNLVEEIVLDAIPFLFGQKPNNFDGEHEEFKDYMMKDKSNDEIATADIEEIIIRSGFDVEVHRVVADDYYLTSLYRVINPKADRSKLKQPPVMVMHGGLVDPTIWVGASSKQHHPEKYPRHIGDGPITSWNRSVAFVLANNGYDVWLVGTRGAEKESQGRLPSHRGTGWKRFFNEDTNMTLTEKNIKLYESIMYWRYSFDDIILLEMPRQIEKILEISGAKNLSLLTYSYSTTISLSLLGLRPDLAEKVHNYIAMAPLINVDSSGLAVPTSCALIKSIPTEVGTILFTYPLNSKLFHSSFLASNAIKRYRYTWTKMAISLISGSSGKYRTFLEPSMLGHLVQPLAFKQLQHACQILSAKQYQKYDYGHIINKLIYNQFKPPKYDISDIHVKNWLLISGENDNFGCQSSIQQILDTVKQKPWRHIDVAGYNHIDLVTAFDVDKRVVLPVLEFLDTFAWRT